MPLGPSAGADEMDFQDLIFADDCDVGRIGSLAHIVGDGVGLVFGCSVRLGVDHYSAAVVADVWVGTKAGSITVARRVRVAPQTAFLQQSSHHFVVEVELLHHIESGRAGYRLDLQTDQVSASTAVLSREFLRSPSQAWRRWPR